MRYCCENYAVNDSREYRRGFALLFKILSADIFIKGHNCITSVRVIYLMCMVFICRQEFKYIKIYFKNITTIPIITRDSQGKLNAAVS